ncbi:HPP family protein [Caulobacter sp. DWP3-1-3b2]|uniref:HPP family protein n=1 Tax=Caulobacter sp. DWP3-1-3b2 TaxID=2804643 RepID=UPI003CF6F301
MIDRLPWAPRLRTASGWLEIGRGGLGALLGLAVTGVLARAMIGGGPLTSPLLVAPIGASAVLVFAVPASPLAQPRSVICGNVLSAVVGIACAHLFPDPMIAAPLAVSLAIMAMALTGCLHPPGGAVALICGLGGSEVTRLGYHFALSPVGLDSLLLVGAGVVFHRVTRRSYPHRAPVLAASPHGTADAPPSTRAGFTSGDLDAALARYGELLDVSRDDLDALFRQVELQAHQRLHAQILCGDIMSADVITVDPQQSCDSALRYMRDHDLRTAPVIDGDRKVLGLVRRAELQANRDHKVEAVIDPFVHRVRESTPIQALLPLLSSGQVHEAVVVDADRVLKGIVTQTDLLAVLYRAHVVEAMAANR